MAFLVGDTPPAVSRKLLNQQEIVNLDHWLNEPITLTLCPLTKSSLVFNRSAVDGAEFDVSGILLHDNLVMVDGRDNESLWPQMQRSVVCGSASGTTLDMVPVLDLTWSHWRSLHPNTKVLPVSVKKTGTSAPEVGDRSRSAQLNSGRKLSGMMLGLPGTSSGRDGPKASGRSGVTVPFQDVNEKRVPKAVELPGEDGPVEFWHPGPGLPWRLRRLSWEQDEAGL